MQKFLHSKSILSFSRSYCIIVLALPVFFMCCFIKASAQGDLLVTPKRVVFDGSKKSYALNLANTGQDTARYNISLIHNRMKDDGSIEKISQPDSLQNFADKYLRFYPHSVVLAPNSSQSVRIQVTNFSELNSGEYRSNLYFRAAQIENLVEEKKPTKDSGISIKIIPVFGISMPIIIQKGESTAKVDFSGVSFQMVKDTMPMLKAIFNRTGNMSVYGDIWVDYISLQGKVTRVGLAKGVAVYSPNAVRHFNLRLNKIPGISYKSGKLHITYSDQSLQPVKLAEAEISLQ